jgi:hypothetical protein
MSLFALVAIGSEQDKAEPPKRSVSAVFDPFTASKPVDGAQSYMVRITEFRINGESEEPVSLERLKTAEKTALKGDIEQVQSLRINIIQGREAFAQFGLREPVVVSTMRNSRSPDMHTYRLENVGTAVRALAEPHDEKILLKIEFEWSRMREAVEKDKPQQIVSGVVRSEVLLEAGKPQVLSSKSGETSTVLVVEIEK